MEGEFKFGKLHEGKAQPPSAGAAMPILLALVLIIEIQRDVSPDLHARPK